MKPIRLEPDELRVESFATGRLPDEPGTVQAHASGASCPNPCTLNEPTCQGPACVTIPVLTCLC